MQLNIEYAQITNQIFHSFLSTVQFQMPIAHSVFKQTVCNVSAQQLQQHTNRNLLQNDTIALSTNS